MFAVLAIASTAPAAEMSSKRDCAICHVMWLSDFRTDKQTLIEWQPGNVLMQDSQGVVSFRKRSVTAVTTVMSTTHAMWSGNTTATRRL